MRTDCKTAERLTVLNALEMSTETAVLEGNKTMRMKPLPGGVNDGLTPIGSLDSKLNGLKDGSCPIRNELNSNLASDAPEGLTHRNGTESPIGFAKRHDGCPTHERPDCIRNP